MLMPLIVTRKHPSLGLLRFLLFILSAPISSILFGQRGHRLAHAWSTSRGGVFMGWFEVGFSRRSALSLPRFAGSVCGSMSVHAPILTSLHAVVLCLLSYVSYISPCCFLVSLLFCCMLLFLLFGLLLSLACCFLLFSSFLLGISLIPSVLFWRFFSADCNLLLPRLACVLRVFRSAFEVCFLCVFVDACWFVVCFC